MDIYTEIAKLVGWPAIVALLIVGGGFAGWFLNTRISMQKEINEKLERELKQSKESFQAREASISVDYGIKITSPKSNDGVGEFTSVTGIYSKIPPPGTLRLFTVKPERTERGERFWPQEIVKEFNTETKTWNAKVHIGDPNRAEWGIIAAIVGQSTTILWDFYYSVGPKVGWWDFQGWPTDSTICSRISVTKG